MRFNIKHPLFIATSGVLLVAFVSFLSTRTSYNNNTTLKSCMLKANNALKFQNKPAMLRFAQLSSGLAYLNIVQQLAPRNTIIQVTRIDPHELRQKIVQHLKQLCGSLDINEGDLRLI